MNLSISGGGNYVDRHTIALVPTPCGTESWKSVPHMEVIEAVTEVVKVHNWQLSCIVEITPARFAQCPAGSDAPSL